MRKPYTPGQEELIAWLSANGARVDEGIPYPERIYISDGRIYVNTYGGDIHTGALLAVEGSYDLTAEPPASLGIKRLG